MLKKSQNNVAPIIITAGEPSGIGMDIVQALATQQWPIPIVICCDKNLLRTRIKKLNNQIILLDYSSAVEQPAQQIGQLYVVHVPLVKDVSIGKPDKDNAQYVINMLSLANDGCLSGQFSALVTGPVHKGIINDAGIHFSGHTEFFAQQSNTDMVVMMLATEGLRVALVTTHLPIRELADAITKPHLSQIITILQRELQMKYGIKKPRIYVCGLNPHAGESGHMGREEIEIIEPTLHELREDGIDLIGPLPADTLFQEKYLQDADVVLAMYHDQGLPVLKYKGFGKAINITLGLPYIRTSVDHGTALDIAGTGMANSNSLFCALNEAIRMVQIQQHN
ncbi:4-hydroxythreonine-4-phosphate dehydrogenase PdxA [Psychromonas sp. CD1]|uniref:4-hydroxythreonine-4-phosphate dehydrogenase PdxA n=1 Tax=Psychromonas sp. CD1 TaxID=1979839 RepID=UPI000B9A456E|nr:4-hydroxythreonine-4-phosphate dehydrogenase PdxA [Psychromonas sp. CD1]